MSIQVQFQVFSPTSGRPSDGDMKAEEMEVDVVGELPDVGDYLSFIKPTDGEPGIYRIRSRFFNYWRDNNGKWTGYVNIVVEDAKEMALELVKE